MTTPEHRSKPDNNRPYLLELFIIFFGCIAVFVLSANFDMLEALVEFSRRHESWELDEIIIVSVFIALAMIVFSMRRWHEAKKSQALLFERNMELEHALEEIKQLEGIIPICSSCKKIRNDSGFWEQVEQYVETYSKAKFSHSLCPDCLTRLYENEKWFDQNMKN